ncbi:S-adenosylmethionine-dependent methyltransferase-like protein [Purpureocillium lavendulum]|uniref:S-adenosylmethionine-dependent methyltransferase-like protein n=1 Tax=Purpureocillium lavendulum TaxID=1247861 RepID=A0AB34FV10_9HYPO|nr:S-adenosylmethionine-dependent methyltransferase-like protein [Purpureocillium lavendulum]
MWEKPGYDSLVDTLAGLELAPPVWSHDRRRDDILAEQESLATQLKAETSRYLSSIIKSPLDWLTDDDEREHVWELASRRMSERCGRSAMGDITRRWPFSPRGDADSLRGSSNSSVSSSLPTAVVASYEPFELIIREPALTGDSLGFKTWGSSYVLAQHLPRLGATSLFKFFDESLGHEPPSVLELGSGTGLLGLAAAALWKVPVALSDLPNIVSNLKHNADANAAVVEARGGSLTVGPLTWGGDEDEVDQELFGTPFQFKIVLAADPLYDDEHPTLLASAIGQHLALGPESRAVVMVPQRDATTVRLLAAFKQAMQDLEAPLSCDEEDFLAGEDDWEGAEEGGGVRCWLGVFSRGGTPTTTYTDAEIAWILDQALAGSKSVDIQNGFRRFGRGLSASQLRYVKGKYGRDPRFNVVAPAQNMDPAAGLACYTTDDLVHMAAINHGIMYNTPQYHAYRYQTGNIPVDPSMIVPMSSNVGFQMPVYNQPMAQIPPAPGFVDNTATGLANVQVNTFNTDLGLHLPAPAQAAFNPGLGLHLPSPTMTNGPAEAPSRPAQAFFDPLAPPPAAPAGPATPVAPVAGPAAVDAPAEAPASPDSLFGDEILGEDLFGDDLFGEDPGAFEAPEPTVAAPDAAADAAAPIRSVTDGEGAAAPTGHINGSGTNPDFGSGWGAMPPPEPLEDPGPATGAQDEDASPHPGARFDESSPTGHGAAGAASSLDQSATMADSTVPSGLPEAASPSFPPVTGEDYDLWGSPPPGPSDENTADGRA